MVWILWWVGGGSVLTQRWPTLSPSLPICSAHTDSGSHSLTGDKLVDVSSRYINLKIRAHVLDFGDYARTKRVCFSFIIQKCIWGRVVLSVTLWPSPLCHCWKCMTLSYTCRVMKQCIRDMDGPRVCYTEWSQEEKKKSYINTYMWNLKNETDELICKTEIETDMENKGMDTKRVKGGWEIGNWEIGIDIYTPLILYINRSLTRTYWIVQGALLSALWWPMGRKSKRGGISVYI